MRAHLTTGTGPLYERVTPTKQWKQAFWTKRRRRLATLFRPLLLYRSYSRESLHMSLCFFRASCLSFFLPSFFEGFLRSVCSFLRPPGTSPSVRLSLCSVCPSVCLYVCPHVCLSFFAVCVCLSVTPFFSFLLSFLVPQAVVLKTVYFVRATRYKSLHTHLCVLIDMI